MKHILALLFCYLMLLTSCLKVLTTAKNDSITLESIIDANYITSIMDKHPILTIDTSIEEGDNSTTVFFLHDGEIARFDEPSGTGVWNGILFTVAEDGSVSATSPMDEFAGDPPPVPLTDSAGRYYSDNAILLYPLLNDTVDVNMAIEYNGKDITIFAGMEGGEYSLYNVDQKTLLIREYYESWSNRTVKVSVADEAAMPPTRAGEALMAVKETRTLTYHTYLSGHEKDYVFEISGDWEFSLGAYGDIRFFNDEGQTKEIDNLVPADGMDYEIWVSDAKG